jgi:hypothetical protein
VKQEVTIDAYRPNMDCPLRGRLGSVRGPGDPKGLTAAQRSVLLAMQTDRQRPRDPDRPLPDNIAVIVGHPVPSIFKAFKRLDELGILPGAWP